MKLKEIIICLASAVFIITACMQLFVNWINEKTDIVLQEEQADHRAYMHIDDSIKTAQFLQRKECREKRFAYQQKHK